MTQPQHSFVYFMHDNALACNVLYTHMAILASHVAYVPLDSNLWLDLCLFMYGGHMANLARE